MNERLNLAKKLLKEDGVIFVSVDDNEQAYLKVLMDEIFGEENFVANLIWQKTTAPKNNSKHFSINHDYILVYSKNKDKLNINLDERTEKQLKEYKNNDNDPRGPWTRIKLRSPKYNKSNDYEIEYMGKVYKQPEGFSWVVSKETMEKLIVENRVYSEGNMLRKKAFLCESKNGVTPISILLKDKVGISQTGTELLRKIIGNLFDYPKPVSLIKYLISKISNKNARVLDFFAGSGTTAHAVLELNKEDGGDRTFTLVTNNENNIAQDVTYERLYRINHGLGTNNETFEWSKKNQPYKQNLNVFELEYSLININQNQINTQYLIELLKHSLLKFDVSNTSEKDLINNLTNLYSLDKE
ncbi:site-specific DNA-methyltransferase [Mycoplasmopsis phocirhinis]|uniref:Site-specific DNA-methyltransferase n=2 Tax=Mycoplasmopsis phocirhinis TaxID=142650 RepID=A0A4P6MSX5_9BACT|nr:site-specific DNA-methyltransferase [Mycoplasmopsis phocirhinis]